MRLKAEPAGSLCSFPGPFIAPSQDGIDARWSLPLCGKILCLVELGETRSGKKNTHLAIKCWMHQKRNLMHAFVLDSGCLV